MEPEVSQRSGRRISIIIFAIIAVVVIATVSGQVIQFWLNVSEFGDLFIRPIYFELYGGLILAALALFRIDFKNRRSIIWWIIPLGLRLLRERGFVEAVPRSYFDFNKFKMDPLKFLMWQITKVFVGIVIFSNVYFGMSVFAAGQGWNFNFEGLSSLIQLPFITPNAASLAYGNNVVVPLMPLLVLFVAPILVAIGTRMAVLLGLTQVIKIVTPNMDEAEEGKFRLGWRIATIEGLLAIVLLWGLINAFFPSNIDYNTRYYIIGLGVSAVILAVMAINDRKKHFNLTSRRILMRVAPIVIILLAVGAVMSVNDSIADARKVEWLGPYIDQQISVNRYLAQLDEVTEYQYNFSVPNVSPNEISNLVNENSDLLSKVRLWDWNAAFAKLKPDIGLIPYVDFSDSDILRFNNSIYWSASMKPIVPSSARTEDTWFNEHMYYTNVPAGFLMLDGHSGKSVNTEEFFSQRTIYYGESGLFSETWAARPVGGSSTQLEVGDANYQGNGGIDISPPISWIFDPTFFWAYQNNDVHVLRYRDVITRMDIVLPYFEYFFNSKSVDMIPITDGSNSYFMIPLIVGLDTERVPWSVNNPFVRLVGYAFIDIYNADLSIYVIGDDFFSDLFKAAYSEYIISEIPEWAMSQIRYPEELFEWRVSMYNFYHVTDAETFIVASEFFEVPQDLDTYYIIAKPPGFEDLEYVGLLSLELRGAGGKNLAGYTIIRNEGKHLGEMIFYEVPLDSPTKLLGPTAVEEALEKDPQFKQLETLWGKESRIGDKILYRVGDHDVYFIPVYTAGPGGVVTELGVVASVSAAFTGEISVGLGNNIFDSYRAFLGQSINATINQPIDDEKDVDQLVDKANELLQLYLESWSEGNYEDAGKYLGEFIEVWDKVVDKTRGG